MFSSPKTWCLLNIYIYDFALSSKQKVVIYFLVRTVGPVFPRQVPRTNTGVFVMCRRVLLVCWCNTTNLSGIVDLKGATVA